MRYSMHVFNTWLLAQIIHLLVFHVWMLIEGSHLGLDSLFQWFSLGVVFSIPAMALCILLCNPLSRLHVNKWIRLLVWAFVASTAVLITVYMIAVLSGGAGFFMQLYTLTLPGCIAAFISVIIRFRQFFNLKHLKITLNENDKSNNHD